MFSPGQRVSWREGRTQRPRRGVVEQVRPVDGWPSEYDVRPLRKDGRPAKEVRLKFESELEGEANG